MVTDPLRVLIAEDNEDDVILALDALRRHGYKPQWKCVETAEAFTEALQSEPWDVVLSDYSMPAFDALKALKIVQESGLDIPFIIVSGTIGEDVAIEALKLGSNDYILKFHMARLGSAVEHEIRDAADRRKRRTLESFINGQVQVLEMIIHGRPLPLILNHIAQRVEEISRGQAHVMVLLADENGQTLSLAAAPSLPVELKQARKTIPIKEDTSSCGTAAALGKLVVIEDIITHPNWASIHDVVKRHDLKSCWSEPVLSSNRQVLGILAIYHCEHRSPTEDELRWVDSASKLTSLAIERSREREQLLHNEQMLRIAGQMTKVGAWKYDIGATHVFWSNEVCHIHGVATGTSPSVDEAIRYYTPESRERLTKVFQACCEKGESYDEELEIINAKGQFLTVRTMSQAVRDDTGKIIRVHGAIQDITAIKEADSQIREQASLLDKTRDAILVFNMDGQITYWNKGAELLYGWTAREAIGESVHTLIHQNRRAGKRELDQLMQYNEWSGEIYHVNKSGETITIDARWTLVRDNQGNPEAILAINTDVTQRKKLEQQFLRAQRMESIGTLAGGIAHDLNNTLAPIMMAADLLKLQIADEKSRSLLETIARSATRGAALVNQVLSFARGMDGQRLELQVNHLLEDIEKIAQDTFPKSIQIQTQIEKKLMTVLGDPTQLHQVLLNLCVNARDAMPKGGKIILRANNMLLDEHYAAMNLEARTGAHIVIEVEDTGTGIDPAIIDKVFDPFFTTKEIHQGTGLGLSTSHAIVKSHGGFIRVYSELNKGTRFRVYLPSKTVAGESKTETETSAPPRGQGEIILVADDESSIRQITKQTLEAFGYRVLLASDGSEAVALYADRRDEIAVVLLDMMMPIMDGPATIQVLIRINPKVAIIAASGIQGYSNLEQLSADHAIRFLPKPYTAEKMLDAIHKSLPKPITPLKFAG